MLTRLLKTPWQQCPGVFLWLLVCAGSMFVEIAVAENHINCSAQHITWHQLASVIDGDTLRLDDGRKVRVLSINTPELVHDVSEAQPLAVEARQAAIEFFKNGDRVGLSLGVDSLDRYGRLLAQVYREDGANLSAYMLAQGLGWQVVVPPNDVNWQCLRQHEDDARKQQLGVWQKGIFPVKKADQLRIQDSGFQRVEGVVSSVNQVAGGWWLQLGQLAVNIKDRDLDNFLLDHPRHWLGQSLTIRGWVIDRSQSKAVIKGGHSALMIRLMHPAMLE